MHLLVYPCIACIAFQLILRLSPELHVLVTGASLSAAQPRPARRSVSEPLPPARPVTSLSVCLLTSHNAASSPHQSCLPSVLAAPRQPPPCDVAWAGPGCSWRSAQWAGAARPEHSQAEAVTSLKFNTASYCLTYLAWTWEAEKHIVCLDWGM